MPTARMYAVGYVRPALDPGGAFLHEVDGNGAMAVANGNLLPVDITCTSEINSPFSGLISLSVGPLDCEARFEETIEGQAQILSLESEEPVTIVPSSSTRVDMPAA
jgi:hypothetical protein